MDDLRRLVSDSIRQKIPSLGANFSVNLRFEEVRMYYSVQVRDSHLVLYDPQPAAQPTLAVAPTPHPTPEVLAALGQKLAAVFGPSGTVVTASAALPPTSTVPPPSATLPAIQTAPLTI